MIEIFKKLFGWLQENGKSYLPQVTEFIKKSAGQVKLSIVKPAIYPVGIAPLVITGAFPRYTDGTTHKGVDFACEKNAMIRAICPGTATHATTGKKGDPNPSAIWVKTESEWIGYKHCLPSVKRGQVVKAGDVIGYADLSGKTTGYHLHFECQDHDGKIIEPVHVLWTYQPKIIYEIMQDKKYRQKIIAIFQAYNLSGWNIIARSKQK